MDLTWRKFMKFILLFLLLNLIKNAYSDAPAPWYENLPAVTMDYKVHLDPGKEDCYFQYVQPGATFYASYQVTKSLNWHIIVCIARYIQKLLSHNGNKSIKYNFML